MSEKTNQNKKIHAPCLCHASNCGGTCYIGTGCWHNISDSIQRYTALAEIPDFEVIVKKGGRR